MCRVVASMNKEKNAVKKLHDTIINEATAKSLLLNFSLLRHLNQKG